MAGSKGSEANNYGTPESFFVFIVGNCEEWPVNREAEGDIAIHREYLTAGVPPEQVVFLKDKDASLSKCKKQLKKLLKNTRPSTTLVFYFGGHGVPAGFETRRGHWLYRDVVSTIDTLFQGERVLFLLDCCASGNLCTWLSSPNVVQKDYVCLASSPPFVTTSDEGDEWVLNRCWIQSMRRNKGDIPLRLIMEYLADRTALVLGDQFFSFCTTNVDCESGDWVPISNHSSAGEAIDWDRLETHIPSEAKVNKQWSVGDYAFYKHLGGLVHPRSEYVPPCWLLGRFLSKPQDGHVKMEVKHPLYGMSWGVDANVNHLMNDIYMAQMWMLPDLFEEAQTKLASSFKYLDFSLSASTAVIIVTPSGTKQPGRVIDWRDFDWKSCMDSDVIERVAPFGAHVPVQIGAEPPVLIPVTRLHPSKTQTFPQDLAYLQSDESKWERAALVESIKSGGKKICSAKSLVGRRLAAFWPEDDVWYDVDALDPTTAPLHILATHANFTLQGFYTPLAYEDGDFALSPLHYVRKRRRCPCL